MQAENRIKKNYLKHASKIMSATKIAASTHVTTGISFARFPATFAIT
jgi:hypothetical protein